MKTCLLWFAVLVMNATTFGFWAKSPVAEQMPSLARADTWLNSAPLKDADLRGKVVLVDFWTYTCINWRRTLPYLRAWSQKYQDHGLVIVGVHTPEFSFEKDLDNIRRAAKEQDVAYPIAIDSDYAIWQAFDNRYWPSLYFVDGQGRIRHQKIGEDNYAQLEMLIRQLLSDTGKRLPPAVGTIDGRGAERSADWNNLRTPETYVAYARSEGFSSAQVELLNQSRVYSVPAQLDRNEWALAGDWTMKKEFSVPNAPGAKVALRFHARDVHLVMGPGRSATARIRVLIDGKPPGAAHGVDVDAAGNGTIDQPRMYQLIRQDGAIEDRLIEVEFRDAGAQVFAFTFG